MYEYLNADLATHTCFNDLSLNKFVFALMFIFLSWHHLMKTVNFSKFQNCAVILFIEYYIYIRNFTDKILHINIRDSYFHQL